MNDNPNMLIYTRGNDTTEAKSIELKIPNGITCEEFKIICIRMAHAIGYHESSVRETFGNINDSNINKNKNQLNLLFD